MPRRVVPTRPRELVHGGMCISPGFSARLCERESHHGNGCGLSVSSVMSPSAFGVHTPTTTRCSPRSSWRCESIDVDLQTTAHAQQMQVPRRYTSIKVRKTLPAVAGVWQSDCRRRSNVQRHDGGSSSVFLARRRRRGRTYGWIGDAGPTGRLSCATGRSAGTPGRRHWHRDRSDPQPTRARMLLVKISSTGPRGGPPSLSIRRMASPEKVRLRVA